MSDVKVDKVLDLRGLTCPMPLLKTKKELKGMKAGEVLEVWGTDEGSKKDIPDFVNKKHEFLSLADMDEGYTKYLIKA
ncbi:Preprotein translocase subunit TatC [Candidatus Desulfarcum epimagneticum]|uniref:Preprotein translocase subunit TatC n=1 Tax=uncultured Desulfobacteraceae bacterium TaxID=218296 RepID=A0A484HJL4_9BACT|nr:Preprotein translocase subunit TatC [uncultured Desulfobacteraceae bacterium]